jgi:hypothetical protein
MAMSPESTREQLDMLTAAVARLDERVVHLIEEWRDNKASWRAGKLAHQMEHKEILDDISSLKTSRTWMQGVFAAVGLLLYWVQDSIKIKIGNLMEK